MGKFSDAVSEGRKQATDESERNKATSEARAAAQKAASAAGKKWIEEVVRPVVERANSDLSNEKLIINCDLGSGDRPSAMLTISTTETRPRSQQSIAFNVDDNGSVKVFHDGGEGAHLGTITDVKSDKIEALLVRLLREIGTRLAH
jgi:hypothetical protein